jgi:4'-phosphopantetheinyl transferase
MSAPASWPAAGDAYVFAADVAALAAQPDRTDRWLDWLTPAEQARFDRFRRDEDRLLFLCGRGMARELVGRALGVAPDAWAWSEGPHGRPGIAGHDAGVRFNVAHSAGLVVCGLARGGEIGVDVEDRERGPIDRALVRRYCSPAEAVDIESRNGAWRDRFLEYWTLKEAYLKARGLGIALPLASLDFSLDGDAARLSCLPPLTDSSAGWVFALFRPSSRHVAAVATLGATARIGRFE